MLHRLQRLGPALFVTLVTLLAPAAADAEWFFTVYFGSQHTTPATISIDQPSLGTSLDFHDVVFDGKPTKWPPYYGGRLAWFRPNKWWGLEFEFLHSKVYSRTSDIVHVTGTLENAAIDTTMRMDDYVERFNMTHGHNFLLVNGVVRRAIGPGDRFTVVARAGAGLTFQGVDSVVRGTSWQTSVDWSGAGGQLAAGLDVRIAGPLFVSSEVKLTLARPTIEIDQGTGRTSALTRQFAIGGTIRLSRR